MWLIKGRGGYKWGLRNPRLWSVWLQILRFPQSYRPLGSRCSQSAWAILLNFESFLWQDIYCSGRKKTQLCVLRLARVFYRGPMDVLSRCGTMGRTTLCGEKGHCKAIPISPISSVLIHSAIVLFNNGSEFYVSKVHWVTGPVYFSLWVSPPPNASAVGFPVTKGHLKVLNLW